MDEDLNTKITRRLGIKGVLVLNVQPGSSAERAGLMGTRMGFGGQIVPGDLILELNGNQIESVSNLHAVLDEHRVGDLVSLLISRQGRNITIDITLQAGI